MTACIKMSIFITLAGFRQNGPILGIAMCLVVAIDSLCKLSLGGGSLADLQLTILAKTKCTEGHL